MVMEVVDEDMDGLGMACTDHPYKTQTAGGICAFCLQDKLGKLVSSSFPSAIFPAASVVASSLNSPSDGNKTIAAVAAGGGGGNVNGVPVAKHTPRARASFLGKSDVGSIIFRRSKSTAVGNRPRGFWSFLARDGTRVPGIGSSFRHRSLRERRERESGGECDDERKVSRSRSVGCGSRSFSGDFFERLSTGLGDCALRRVESQREGKPKNTPVHGPSGDRVRCGGIFGSFSSSSTTTTSSSSSATNFPQAPPAALAARGAAHGRSRSWGWALASPMRAFSSSKMKRENGGGKRPNLNAIPSILAVGG